MGAEYLKAVILGVIPAAARDADTRSTAGWRRVSDEGSTVMASL